MENKKQLKNLFIGISLTIIPILIYILATILGNKSLDIFSGRFMYISQDNYFSISPSFVLDLPYLLPPIIWAFAILFCLKIRRKILNQKSLLNFLILVLLTLNSIFLVYSLWFICNMFFL